MIWIDRDAAGSGWFLDSTPSLSEEYLEVDGELVALDGTAAAEGVDLLSVLIHEFSRAAGLEPTSDDVMAEPLTEGHRTWWQRLLGLG